MMSTIKIVSFNLRCVWIGDGINSFIFRAGMIYDKIMRETPDMIAFQEVTANHLDLLKRMLPEYVFCGQFRSQDYTGEGLFTAIRKDAWDVIAYEAFWISPTPYVAGSRFESQSNCPRICVVTQIRHKHTGKMLRLFNIHLDHVSDTARIKGIQCVLEAMAAFNEKLPLPSFVLGDYNADPDSETIRFCNSYPSPAMFDVTHEIPVSYHGYGSCGIKIDYIYVTEEAKHALLSSGIWAEESNGIYLSDHYPVWAEFSAEAL
jgi:endonuclease/exonuclease/phosphatase family metal-dependent hydrolase